MMGILVYHVEACAPYESNSFVSEHYCIEEAVQEMDRLNENPESSWVDHYVVTVFRAD